MPNIEWLKPAALGAIAGAAGLAVVGFTWGGWVTGATAEEQAAARGKIEMVNALLPLCVAHAQGANPNVAETLAAFEDARTYQRAEILMKAGWATPPGTDSADRELARACAEKLAATS